MYKDIAIQKIVEDCLAILRAKGADYQDDISPLGIRGCFANLFRKVMRLKSLIWDEREAKVTDETLEDTLLDLINYGIITELLRRGEWTLPWEEGICPHTHTYRMAKCVQCGAVIPHSETAEICPPHSWEVYDGGPAVCRRCGLYMDGQTGEVREYQS